VGTDFPDHKQQKTNLVLVRERNATTIDESAPCGVLCHDRAQTIYRAFDRLTDDLAWLAVQR